MDQRDQRMECLRMAIELGGKAEPIVSAAQQLLDFVSGTQHPGIAASTELVSVEAAEPQPGPAAAPEAVATDAIAACGTALVMPEGGALADAMPSVEAAEGLAATPEVSTHAQTDAEVAPAVSVCEPASAGAPAKVVRQRSTSFGASRGCGPTSRHRCHVVPTANNSELPCEPDPVQGEKPCSENAEGPPAEVAQASPASTGAVDGADAEVFARRLRKPKHAKPVRTAGLCY